MQIFFLLKTHFESCFKHKNGLFKSCTAKHMLWHGLSSDYLHVYAKTQKPDKKVFMCAQSPQNNLHCRRLLKSPQKIAGKKDMWKNHKYSQKKLKVTGNRKRKKWIAAEPLEIATTKKSLWQRRKREGQKVEILLVTDKLKETSDPCGWLASICLCWKIFHISLLTTHII